jgi:glutaminase A
MDMIAGDHQADAGRSAGPIDHYLATLHTRLKELRDGEVANYIPELAKADPDLFGIAIATVDGKVYATGDSERTFTIQSTSKAFIYGYILAEYGRDAVLKHIGVEPTGDTFNSILLDDVENRPFNPMVNSGAMAAAELIKGDTPEARIATMLDVMSRFAGRSLFIDENVFRSEQATGHRNRAIAYMMLNSGMIQSSPESILDVYFRQCSVRVTCRDLAVMAATLANDGVNPITGVEAIPRDYIQDVLTVMNSCGMYNFAGQWSYEVGMPAKSGVAGGIVAVIPGQIGIGVFSPRLDRHGHSVRGVRVCRELSETFGLHVFRNHTNTGAVIRRELFGNVVHSKRRRTAEEHRILDELGARICLIEVQGGAFLRLRRSPDPAHRRTCQGGRVRHHRPSPGPRGRPGGAPPSGRGARLAGRAEPPPAVCACIAGRRPRPPSCPARRALRRPRRDRLFPSRHRARVVREPPDRRRFQRSRPDQVLAERSQRLRRPVGGRPQDPRIGGPAAGVRGGPDDHPRGRRSAPVFRPCARQGNGLPAPRRRRQ